ncbi:unnamed protein product [Rhizoctonia solani]|uniref:HAT C-terminal dimerisation domain-containing protein n=1 Tax=Rhizoctonia solani TaxID=456999 RepID=A0A8H3GTW8_9AGAM|nr:unnamed protein product [Rhizoctonia solani]
MDSYLETSVVPTYMLPQYGSIVSYWNDQLEGRPRLSRMVLGYFTAPGESLTVVACVTMAIDILLASSVDTERAFRDGRLMTNHLQHQMSSRTSQSQMAIGPWFSIPLISNLHHIASVIEENM